MQRRALLLSACACAWGLGGAAGSVWAQAPAVPATPANSGATSPGHTNAPAELAAEWPGSKLQGQGRLTFMTMRVYEARLWSGATPIGTDWGAGPLALEMIYARSLGGARIAERSLAEMQRQGEIDSARSGRWLSAMKQIFPDVKEGDRITGVNVPGVGARFYVNGKLVGDVRDTDFARLFFGIWLSPKTSEPGLREALLGKPS